MTSGAGGGPKGRGRAPGWDRLLRLCAVLVPEEHRDEWLKEWRGELEMALLEATGRGGAHVVAAAAEDAWRWRLRATGTGAWREARVAARSLRRAPLFTATVVATLAVGMGANAALFTVIDAALLEPLPYPAADRLVAIGTGWTGEGGGRTAMVSTPDFDDLAREIRGLEEAAFRVRGSATYLADEPLRLEIASVSASFFRLFGTGAALGRYFHPDEDVPGSAAVVLSHGFWRRVFGGDPGVLGRTLTLDGQPYVVVGVAEEALRDPSADVDAWTSRPAWIDLAKRDQPWVEAYGRLAPGVTLQDARAEIAALSGNLAREYPATNTGHVLTVDSLRERVAGPARGALQVLAAVVILVLAITCANVANLVLVRSAGRGREVAVRLSLGAGRGRLTRQLLMEGLLLALAGGLAALALAAATTRAFVALGAPGLPRLADVRPDGTVLLFTLLLSGSIAMVVGLAPLLQVSGSTPADVLREGGRGGESRRVGRVRRAIVVAELAGSAMLLVGAGLLVRSLVHLTHMDTGVRTERVLTFRVAPPQATSPSTAGRAELREFYGRVLEEIERIPGVEAVGGVNILPFTEAQVIGVTRDDRPREPGRQMMTDARVIEPGYFDAVGIRHVAGRLLDDRDTEDAPPAVAVDEEFARLLFPGEDPVGRRITMEWSGGPEPVSYEIVGVVGSVRHGGPASPPSPTVYLHRGHDTTPYWMHFAHTFTVRAQGAPMSLADDVRTVVWSVDRTVPITEMRPFGSVLDGHVAGTRYRMLLIGGFALLATLLAAVGIGGIVAYAVAQRSRELGIRQALGAAPAAVVRMILAEGVRLAAVGVTAGLILAALGTRALRSFLVGVEPADPLTYGVVALALVAVTVASAWIPARHASRVRPGDALRREA